MTDIFISYSRKDIQVAQRIVQALAENNLDTWVDWMSIPKGEDWQQEIYRGIEEADTFLFLISPDSVASGPCNDEIKHAVENGKRILPVFVARVEDRGIYEVTNKFLNGENRKQINLRNFVLCRDGMDDFQKAIDDIKTTIHKDYEWLKYHTKLQNKALDWDRHKKISRLDGSRLIRGKELREARQQLAKKRIMLDPLPTPVQKEYILASSKREKWVRSFMVLTFLILSVAALIAYAYRSETQVQAQAAGQQRRLARSRQLADLSASFLDRYPDQNKLLAIEAVKLGLDAGEPVAPEAARALRNSIRDLGILILNGNFRSNNLNQNKHGPQIVAEHSSYISDVQFSPDNQWFASSDGIGTVFLSRVNTSTGNLTEPVPLVLSTSTSNIIRKLAFSPDSRWLAAASDDGVFLLDLRNPSYTFQKIGNHIGYLIVTFSPDSRLLFSGGYGIVEISDMEFPSSQPLELKITEDEDVWTIAVSPDNQWLAAGSLNSTIFAENQGAIYLWQLSELQKNPVILPVPDGRIKSLAFSPDGAWLASASFQIRLWDMRTAGKSFITLATLPTLANEISFSPDGKWLAGAFSNHKIMRLWDMTTRDFAVTDLLGHTDEIFDIAFNADSTLLASASLDDDIRIWDLSDPANQSSVLKGNEAGVLRVTFNPTGQWLASGGDDAKVRLWDLKSNSLFDQESNPIASSAICPIDSRIAASYVTGNIKIWDVKDGAGKPEILQTPMGSIVAVSYSPQCTWLAGQDLTGEVFLWNTSGLMHSPMVLKTQASIVHFAFRSDEKSIAAALSDGSIQVWNLGLLDVAPVTVAQSHTKVTQLDFSQDGRWLIWGESYGDRFVLYAWDMETPATTPIQLQTFDTRQEFITTRSGSRLATLAFDDVKVWSLEPSFENLTGITSYDTSMHHYNPFTSFAFSPNGDYLAFGMQDGLVNVMDMFTLDNFAIGRHQDVINTMAFSHGGQWLVTGSNDNMVRLWDLNTIGDGEVLSGYADGVVSLGFTGNDRWIVTRSRDSDLVLWLADIKNVLDMACSTVSRNFTAEEWSLYFPGEPYRITCRNLPTLVNLEEQQANQQALDQMNNWLLKVQLMIVLVPLLVILLFGFGLFVAIQKIIQYRSNRNRAGQKRSR